MRHGRRRAARRRGDLKRSEPESLDRTVAGRRLEIVRLRVDGEGRDPIVLLHEGLGPVSAWRDFPQRVAERIGRDVVVSSRYGYGKSDVLAGPRDVSYMHDEALHVLPELLDSLCVEKPVLLGHSDGASIAVIFSGAYPDRVRGLVLEAPHVFVEDAGLASIARAKSAFETTGLAGKLARHHLDARKTFAGWNDVWLDPRFREWNIATYLDAIAVPVLVLQGTDDEYGTSAQVETIRARTKARAVMLEDCGHAPHRDRPERTLDEIAAFVSEL